MSWERWLCAALLVACIWWLVVRAERGFRRGYLLALDHLEEMTRPGVSASYELGEALRKLRSEVRTDSPSTEQDR